MTTTDQTVQNIMTVYPHTLDRHRNVTDAAAALRVHDIGGLIITDAGKIYGMVTDRDIVTRCVAQGFDPNHLEVGNIATRDIARLTPSDSLDTARDLMRKRAIRRLPVIDSDGAPIGIVSLGDLTLDQDPASLLGAISDAPTSS